MLRFRFSGQNFPLLSSPCVRYHLRTWGVAPIIRPVIKNSSFSGFFDQNISTENQTHQHYGSSPRLSTRSASQFTSRRNFFSLTLCTEPAKHRVHMTRDNRTRRQRARGVNGENGYAMPVKEPPDTSTQVFEILAREKFSVIDFFRDFSHKFSRIHQFQHHKFRRSNLLLRCRS